MLVASCVALLASGGAAAFATDASWRQPILIFASGVEQRPARWAHNPEVAGSTPAPAIPQARPGNSATATAPLHRGTVAFASVNTTTDVFLPPGVPGAAACGSALQRCTALDGEHKPRTPSGVPGGGSPSPEHRPAISDPDSIPDSRDDVGAAASRRRGSDSYHATPPRGATRPLRWFSCPETPRELAAGPATGSSPFTSTQAPAPRGATAGRGSSDATFARRSARLARSGRSEHSHAGQDAPANIHATLIRH